MPGNPAVVLLLEDEPLIAIDVEETLRNAGFAVTTKTSCAEANDWLDMFRPDLVVVDIVLRDGPSNPIAERLIADRIPFLVHSANHPSMHDGTPFGLGRWIGKPADPAALVQAARELTAPGI